MTPVLFARLLACARLSAEMKAVTDLIAPDRRDEYVAACAQAMGCVLGVTAAEATAACTRVTAEFDAKDAARRAGQP